MAKIAIITYGCATNQGDSDLLRAALLKAGYKIVAEKDADIVIFNTCGVKESTENKIFNALKNVSKGKKIIITGCLPLICQRRFWDEGINYSALLGPSYGDKIVDVVKQVEQGKRVIDLTRNMPCFFVPQVEKETGILVIAQGCLSKCTYCATKFARGNLQSFSVEELTKRCKELVKAGAKKILLTAQDTGAYGIDIKTNLPNLLNELIKITGDFQIRIGMMNPNYALKYSKQLVDIYKSPKIMKFIHIPVQAGSNSVLKAMRRGYKVEDFVKVVALFRKNIPNLILSTDIICGFPTETEKDFKQTLAIVKKIKPEVINISKFYPRPGTEAANMKQLSTEIVKARSKELFEIMKAIRSKRKIKEE